MKTGPIILLSFFLSVSAGAMAQQVETPAQKAAFQSVWMQTNLGINEAQSKKVYSIVQHFAELDGQPDADVRANSRTKDADIRAVLTADQYRKYHKHLPEMSAQELQQPAPRNN
jgi:hypothetical protein